VPLEALAVIHAGRVDTVHATPDGAVTEILSVTPPAERFVNVVGATRMYGLTAMLKDPVAVFWLASDTVTPKL
jgi:hypothetical protein